MVFIDWSNIISMCALETIFKFHDCLSHDEGHMWKRTCLEKRVFRKEHVWKRACLEKRICLEKCMIRNLERACL